MATFTITAETAIEKINAGQATADGITRNDYDMDCVIITDRERSCVCHVELSDANPTPAMDQLRTMAAN